MIRKLVFGTGTGFVDNNGAYKTSMSCVVPYGYANKKHSTQTAKTFVLAKLYPI